MSYREGCPDPGAVLDGDLVDLDDARESGDGLGAAGPHRAGQLGEGVVEGLPDLGTRTVSDRNRTRVASQARSVLLNGKGWCYIVHIILLVCHLN